MEESFSVLKICSRKRKKNGSSSPNSNPSLGILTRSKSRVYLHQNRSGKSRSDPIPSKSIPDSISLEAFLYMNRNNTSCLSSIKDLRMKRVFTPGVNSVPQEEKDEGEETKEERKKLLKCSDASRILVPDEDDVKVDELGNSGLLKLETENGRNDMANGLNSKDQVISGNGSLSSSKMALSRRCRKKVFKTSSSLSYRRLLPYLMDIANDDSSVSKIEIVDGVNCEVRSTSAKTECYMPQCDIEKVHVRKSHENHINDDDASVEEHLQATPPDSGIFARTEFDNVRESMEANKELVENHTFRGLLVDGAKNNSDALSQSPNSKFRIHSMNGSALAPCSRLKLFKNPRSVSYKRLLPYLMDISKNNSCATRNTQGLIPQVVSEDDNSVNKIEPMVSLPPSDGSSPANNDILVSSMPQLSSASYSSNLDLQTEELPQIQTSPTKSGHGLDLKDNTSPSKQSSMVDSDILTKQCVSEDPESVGKQNMCLDVGLGIHTSNFESNEKVNLERKSFQAEASSDALVCPINGPSKGILKRNRLGCRGLCNCLNCTSFRLHADRAFEFSRNQMCYAEEVVSLLMNELADLRHLLEKPIIQNNDSAGMQLNPVLAKQACNKALEAEKMAKERLMELNYDLNVHCRIPALLQPKVTFANNIQE